MYMLFFKPIFFIFHLAAANQPKPNEKLKTAKFLQHFVILTDNERCRVAQKTTNFQGNCDGQLRPTVISQKPETNYSLSILFG